jgi:hypothetical protein
MELPIVFASGFLVSGFVVGLICLRYMAHRTGKQFQKKIAELETLEKVGPSP